MAALIDLRRRIKSVRNTQQITQAMKTVSTAKFRKSQKFVLESRPFWHGYPDLLRRVAFWAGTGRHPLLEEREEKRITGVVMTSDKGLCGAFNSNLLARASLFFEEKARQAEVRLILIGKKAATFFKKLSYPVDRAYAGKVDKLSGADLKELAGFLMMLFVYNRTDGVYIVYNEFKSILSPRITILRLLPPGFPDKDKDRDLQPPDWEPEADLLLESLLPHFVESQLAHCFFESQAAEHAARMMAMDNAAQNAEELISDLILELNKIRQASITKEILEIMTAVEALGR